MIRRPVLIDTDTGVDDALALCMAFRSPEINVVGVTTVAGNVEVGRCTRNVHALLDRLQVRPKPKIVAGAARPSVLPLVTAPEVHGRGGMGRLTSAAAPEVRAGARHAARFIVQQARQYGAGLTIVAIGPLTNLAAAYRLDPETMHRVGRVISMGGAFGVPGNTGPVAEFNYVVDPHAVDVVLARCPDLMIIPLDVTEQHVLPWDEVVRRTRKGPGRWMRRLLRGYMEYHAATEGFLGAYLHDPIAVAEAIEPGIVQTRVMEVEIVARDGPARGMTTCRASRRRSSRRVRVAQSLATSAFFRLFDRIWPDA